jgi:leucyl aminopeptidase (aminopeptidase T)
VLREHVEGVLVFDGTIWPPESLGVLGEPVRLTVEGGYVRQVEGGREAHLFAEWLAGFDHPAVYLIDHACYGFNPGVLRPTGRILEDERVFGCMQFGIGATPKAYGSPAHTDGVSLTASVWLDDVQIMDSGRYVLPELVELCQAMGAPAQ